MSVEKNDLDVDVEGEAEENFNSEKLSQNALQLQQKLDQLKQKICQARAQKSARKHIQLLRNNQIFEQASSDELHKLTGERTKSFLDFTSVQMAIRSAEVNKALTKALQLEKNGDGHLEPEEEKYVRELLEEQRELTLALLKNQDIGSEQELQIIEARYKLYGLLTQYNELRSKAGPILLRDEDKEEAMQRIEKSTKDEDSRLNQMRLMIQKLMMGEKDFGCIFDKETNERYKKMFLRCGMSPDEFRKERLSNAAA